MVEDASPVAASRFQRGNALFRSAFPGLLAAATVAMAATFLSEHYGGPVMLFALLLGIAFQFLSQEGRCAHGIEVAARNVLRFGVALLGARITVEQIASLGIGPLIAVIVGVVLTVAVGGLAGRAMGLGGRFGVLSGGAVAICGASAALAIASILPKDEDSERDTIFTVIAVTTLSTVAMIFYPMVVGFLQLDTVNAGFFLGSTIHDVAQVVGAGYSISERTGDFATFTKLLRVAMLLPVMFTLAVIYHVPKEPGQKRKIPFQGFLLAFAALVAVNSAGAIPEPLRLVMVDASRWCLVIAISALGMKTSLQALAQVGVRPIALIVAQTLFLALFILGLILFVL
ncbi:MAG: putative sulfate exporter family transporter [Rhodospirillales bacterium]|nr:putative sulfate exporter family transporter [Rhodospirillales bacterium]